MRWRVPAGTRFFASLRMTVSVILRSASDEESFLAPAGRRRRRPLQRGSVVLRRGGNLPPALPSSPLSPHHVYQMSTKKRRNPLGRKGFKFTSSCMSTKCLPRSLFAAGTPGIPPESPGFLHFFPHVRGVILAYLGKCGENSLKYGKVSPCGHTTRSHSIDGSENGAFAPKKEPETPLFACLAR